MPLYEYKCLSCELLFEVRQKFSDAPLKTCRECGAEVTKVISQGGFALKGGGWYEQGYSASKSTANCPASSAASCGGCSKSTEK